jgi:hypothetical protein
LFEEQFSDPPNCLPEVGNKLLALPQKRVILFDSGQLQSLTDLGAGRMCIALAVEGF